MTKNRTVARIADQEVDVRLEELGFPRAVINETREHWIAGMNSGTEFHAENFPGTMAYHNAVATLRLEGREYGLEKLSRSNVQLCVNPKTRVAIVIAQGDARTGDVENLHLKPSTKYPRGPVSCEVLSSQLSLFKKEEVNQNLDPYEVWILMFYKCGDETRAELSRPSVIDEDAGTILNWHERIFLGTVVGSPLESAEPADLRPTEAVVVPVKKRG